LFYVEAGLTKCVGQSPFGQTMVHWHNGSKSLLGGSFFKGNVAALLAQFEESGPLKGADKALSGDTRKLRHLPGDFDNRPEGLLLGGAVLGATPGFEVQLDRFAEIRPRGFDIFALRSHIEFGTARHIQVTLFGDQGGKAVGHIQMLMEVDRGSKLGGLKS